MNLSNLSSFYSKFGDYAKDFAGEIVKYSPKIHTYLGVAGIFGTAIVSYKTYPKVEAIVEEHNNSWTISSFCTKSVQHFYSQFYST